MLIVLTLPIHMQESHSAAIVGSIMAQNLSNLSEDILLALNRVL